MKKLADGALFTNWEYTLSWSARAAPGLPSASPDLPGELSDAVIGTQRRMSKKPPFSLTEKMPSWMAPHCLWSSVSHHTCITEPPCLCPVSSTLSHLPGFLSDLNQLCHPAGILIYEVNGTWVYACVYL